MNKNNLGYHWLCLPCDIKSREKGKCQFCGKELVHHDNPEHFIGYFKINKPKEVKK